MIPLKLNYSNKNTKKQRNAMTKINQKKLNINNFKNKMLIQIS